MAEVMEIRESSIADPGPLGLALVSVFTCLEVTFILLDLAEFGIISSVPGGIFGLITAACAWYTSAAGILNPLYGRALLPIGPRGLAVKKEK